MKQEPLIYNIDIKLPGIVQRSPEKVSGQSHRPSSTHLPPFWHGPSPHTNSSECSDPVAKYNRQWLACQVISSRIVFKGRQVATIIPDSNWQCPNQGILLKPGINNLVGTFILPRWQRQQGQRV